MKKSIGEKAHDKAMRYYEAYQLGKSLGKDSWCIFPAALYAEVALNFAIDEGVGEPSISILRKSAENLLKLANAKEPPQNDPISRDGNRVTWHRSRL